jgi:putative peptide zinc metalloprotease protein
VARQTKLELLIRGEDGQGFELRELPSALAYLQYRPQRVAAESYELARLPSGVDRHVSWVLKNRTTEQYLLLTDPERFLWEQMDGRATLQEIATAYVLRYGAFDFDLIPALIAKLRTADLLTLRPTSRLREVLARHGRNPAAHIVEATLKQLERLTVRSRRVQASISRLYRWGGFLAFSPVALVAGLAMAALGVLGMLRLWPEATALTALLTAKPILTLVLLKLLLFATMAVHQLLHALACVHYGRRVREFGFTVLYGFIPTFYADVTDIFMASRRARIVTALAGPLLHLFLGGLWLWVAAQMAPGYLQSLIAASGLIQWQALLVSLYPFCFLEMDGYHILADLLGFPTLSSDAWHFVRHELKRRVVRGMGLDRRETIWVGYFFLSLVSILAYLVSHFWGVVQVRSGS